MSYKTFFGSKRTYVLSNPVLQLPILPRINSADSEICVESITVTNTYEFNFGLTFGVGGDEGAPTAAFNLGASYSWSKSVGTTRTLTQPRPSNSLQYCGYWTFLPYYIAYVIFGLSHSMLSLTGHSSGHAARPPRQPFMLQMGCTTLLSHAT